MTGLEYGLFDCDTHCYETRDSFTRYLPKQWQQHAIAPVRLHDGTERILAADRIATFNSEQGLGFDLAYRPGSLGAAGDLAVFGLDELDWAADVFVTDLPEGARRLRRPAGGYRYTVLAGTVVQAGGELTGARPGRVLRH